MVFVVVEVVVAVVDVVDVEATAGGFRLFVCSFACLFAVVLDAGGDSVDSEATTTSKRLLLVSLFACCWWWCS